MLLALILTSCNNTKYLAAGESLVVRNKIDIDAGDEKISKKNRLKDGLKEIPYQKPNRKMLGVMPVRLGLYNLANRKKETKFRWWIKNKVGEAPVIYNRELAKKTEENMETYLFNKGYLHGEVSYESKTKNKKTVTTYQVTPKAEYDFGNVTFPQGNTIVEKAALTFKDGTLIKPGNSLDVEILDAERKRISRALQNDGFFYFSQDFITYDLDTIDKGKKVDVKVIINERDDGVSHERYTVKDVYVYTDYKLQNTLVKEKLDTVSINEYHFIDDDLKFRSRVLADAIFFSKGKFYSFEDYQKTLIKYNNYGAFKFANIEFKDLKDSLGNTLLDAYIFLTPEKKQSVSVDLEASHSFEGRTGSAITYSYKNRNLFGGADLLEFNATAGVELQFKRKQDVLNSADLILETNYYVNRFLVPFPLKKVSKNSNVKTKFSLRYNYERRKGFYTLHSTYFSFGYDWFESANKRHLYNPIYINFFLLPEDKKTEVFQQRLDETPSLARSFEEQVIAGSTYTFKMHTKKSDDDDTYMGFTGDIRLAGNFLHAGYALANRNSGKTKPYTIFSKEYSQFARFEGDVRYYRDITRHSSLAIRLNAGIAVPYGNSDAMPFFQQFYSGGPNSIRAFQLRQLGPGSFSDEESFQNNNFFFDQAGDIRLETNAEYRFDMYKWLKGALFLDVGNVWLLKEDVDRPDGHFSGNFVQDLAIGTGAGLRFDFTYFVIRLDIGVPLRDPRLPAGDRWTFRYKGTEYDKFIEDYTNLNIAIGYPF